MPRKISDEKRRLIEKLEADGLPVPEIARRAGVSYTTAYGYARVRQRTNPETGKPFQSYVEYEGFLTRQRTNPETGKPFESYAEYRGFLTRQRTNPETGKPFESLSDYHGFLARQRINPETGKPFESRNEYEGFLARQRQKDPFNTGIGDLIKKKLTEIGKTQRWLAGRLGVTEVAVSRYVSGKTFPRKELAERLFEELGVDRIRLDFEDGDSVQLEDL